MVLYQAYVGLFSLVVMSRRLPKINHFLETYLMRSEYMLSLWTASLILDEWNQWVVNPLTFVVDVWNAYDYWALSLTSFSIFLKLGPTDEIFSFLLELFELTLLCCKLMLQSISLL